MNARNVAVNVLLRVSDGAWASRVLDTEIDKHKLDRRDAALATQLVYGTLRTAPLLDREIDKHAKKTDTFVRAVLRIATFEIHYLDRIPVRASVNEAVSLVRKKRGKRVAGFVNAVLRKMRAPDTPLTPSLVMPSWVEEELRQSVGEERASAWTGEEPGIDLRVFDNRDVWLEKVRQQNPEFQCTTFGEHGVRMAGGDPRQLEGFNDGAFQVQEAGSQFIVDLLPLEKHGIRVADCCAGRGGKTLSIAARLDPTSEVMAFELHPYKMDQLAEQLESWSHENAKVTPICADLSVGTAGYDDEFDVVLIDAPCSGLGTAVRRPEILLRLRPDDLMRLAELQRSILDQAWSLVKPGGELFFVTCSFARDEGPEVLSRSAIPSDFELVPAHPLADDDGILRLGPWFSFGRLEKTDGYQVARFVRK